MVRSIIQLSVPMASIWPSHGMTMSFTCMILAIWNGGSYILSNTIIPIAKSPGSKVLEL